jgi:hypothetical protein
MAHGIGMKAKMKEPGASEAVIFGDIGRLQPHDVDAILILRAGDMLMASDDACTCLLAGSDAILVSNSSKALSIINPKLVENMASAGKIVTVMLATTPHAMARRALFGLLPTNRFATVRIARHVLEAAIAGLPREPVTKMETIRDVV